MEKNVSSSQPVINHSDELEVCNGCLHLQNFLDVPLRAKIASDLFVKAGV
jgi:hypothetical protein